MFETKPTLIFQVDLWSARGELPGTLAEVWTRKKEIRYSSRTRAGTDSFKYVQRLRRAMTDLIEKLPDDLRNCSEVQLLGPVSDHKVYNIAHLIYRARNYEGHSKDLRFLAHQHAGALVRRLSGRRSHLAPSGIVSAPLE